MTASLETEKAIPPSITPEVFLDSFRTTFGHNPKASRGQVLEEYRDVLDNIEDKAKALAEHQAEQFFRQSPDYDKRNSHTEKFTDSFMSSMRFIGIIALRKQTEQEKNKNKKKIEDNELISNETASDIERGSAEKDDKKSLLSVEDLQIFLNDPEFRLEVMKSAARQMRRAGRHLSVRIPQENTSEHTYKETAPFAWGAIKIHIFGAKDLGEVIEKNQKIGLTFIHRAHKDQPENPQEWLDKKQQLIDQLIAEFPNVSEDIIKRGVLNYPNDPRSFVENYELRTSDIDPEADQGTIWQRKREALRTSTPDGPNFNEALRKLIHDKQYADKNIPRYVFSNALVMEPDNPHKFIERFISLSSGPPYEGKVSVKTICDTLVRYPERPEKRLDYILLRRRFRNRRTGLLKSFHKKRNSYKSAADALTRYGKNKTLVGRIKRFRDIDITLINLWCRYSLDPVKKLDWVREMDQKLRDKYGLSHGIRPIKTALRYSDPIDYMERFLKAKRRFTSTLKAIPWKLTEIAGNISLTEDIFESVLVEKAVEMANKKYRGMEFPDYLIHRASQHHRGDIDGYFEKIVSEIDTLLTSPDTTFIGREKIAGAVYIGGKNKRRKIESYKIQYASLKAQFPEINDYIRTFAFQNSDKPTIFLKNTRENIEKFSKNEAVSLLGNVFLTMAVTHFAEDPQGFLDDAKNVYLDILDQDKYVSLGIRAIKISVLRGPLKATSILDDLIVEIDKNAVQPKNRKIMYSDIRDEVVSDYISGKLVLSASF